MSVDYLVGLSDCRELNQDINKRNLCNSLKYNIETINKLLYWSSDESSKGPKSVVAELIENIDTDLVEAIINYRCDKYIVKRINDIFFSEYCKNNNKLKGTNTINELSVKDKQKLQKIINSATNDYNVEMEKTFEKLEKKLKELISKLKMANSVFMRKKITDEDIKWEYIMLAPKYSDKESSNDGIELEQKKLF